MTPARDALRRGLREGRRAIVPQARIAAAERLADRLLALPFGQVLVGLVALFVIGLGVMVARKGVKKSFEDDLNMSELPPATRSWVERLGRIGWIGKGASYALIGVLVAFAAINADPSESGGMDKALHTLAAQPYGVIALVVIAVGFLGFGAYCFAAAKAHKG